MKTALNKIFTQDIGTIHFIGIGGIGMSGMAEILHTLGYKIQGSDLSENYVTERLKKNGIKIINNHVAANVEGASLIVRSTAVKDDNPEVISARDFNIPIIKRSDMLAELMRFKHAISISGTHGKTTTTSLISTIFDAADLKPTVINGGIINQRGTNAYFGEGDYLIAEADESDGTFIRVPSYVAVITNIDPEHLDYYGTFENAKLAYRIFIENLPFYGFAVLCYDHPVVREIGTSIVDRRIIRYGINETDVDIRAENIRQLESGMVFDVVLNENYARKKRLTDNTIKDIYLGIHGRHNVLNSLAAIAVSIEKNIPIDTIKKALQEFSGVRRRFIKTGEVNGVTIIDDYAHHPEEIKATLSTARSLADMKGGNVIAVMQPHRYSRLKDLMVDFSKSFANANTIIVSDIYSSGEDPIEGVTSEALISAIKNNANQTAIKLDDPNKLAKKINTLAKSSDIVVLLGAGSITKWAYELPKQLENLHKV